MLVESLGPYLSKAVHEDMSPALLEHLQHTLDITVPDKVDTAIPQAVERSLPLILTMKLTRSVTHALLPALTLAMSHSKHQTKICEECDGSKKYCELCHYSTTSIYYMNYYSSKFAAKLERQICTSLQCSMFTVVRVCW